MMTQETTIQPASPIPQPQTVKRRAADWVLFLAGAILIIAGMLKAYDLLRGAVTTEYFFHCTEVLMELAAGVWFISSIAAYYALRAGALLFTIFLAVSLHRAWQGQINCGCFGPVPMNPWITATMDGIFLLMLLAVIPAQAKTAPAERWRKILSALLGLGILCGIMGGAYYLKPGMLHANGTLTGGHGVVFMQPPAWYAKRFPLAHYVPGSTAMMHGKWLAVIYFHTCPVCQHAIAGISRRLEAHPDHHVALIQLPPYGPLPKGIINAHMLQLKASDAHIWRPPFLPVLVDLHNGVVTRVRSYIPGAWYGF